MSGAVQLANVGSCCKGPAFTSEDHYRNLVIFLEFKHNLVELENKRLGEEDKFGGWVHLHHSNLVGDCDLELRGLEVCVDLL